MKIFVTGASGFIGGSIAAHLVRAGHQVRGLIRKPEHSGELKRLGIEPVLGTLDDRALLIAEAQAADAVINAASSDHEGAVSALIEGLAGSGKVFLHTSGSSIVGDASGGEAAEARIYHEDALPQPTADKAARVAIDRQVLEAAQRNIRSAVLCNTLIYGHGAVAGSSSVQLPRLVRQAQKSGVVRHVGSGGNTWSNVHIDDVAELYRLALEKTPAGTFYFVESGEASFRDMSAAIARAMKLGAPQDWPLEEAQKEWGYEMASYGLGSNSRVRGERARKLLGWQPKRTSVIEWIEQDMMKGQAA
ncbi:NAD-dependent epimerase/dehydratase family protein [bacterium M00.F.Ca.ET.228.01.1.1]|uniref:NAD-dependent epimerase/dehydratase family protein n=1 Tax=Paraburkholderia phenoliruptrix TaxID=252970 RepID=UPI001092CD35|nr:NAD-dependent epimerase/dehydratase family protein [Paraburkholderia phenoliruptrix]TGP41250.1 NAD-dependent epimerase/dehydratase family protein [bacterium M00.F.Ca.ET.228.01.1.1]TGR97796.1 NAD-dependent epimerase/dehydratase family protein [bacterium M00.F.Ca.ET.191.01.1.1]TGU01963.1 NAD-dependent epimerase/dehydratase family protein [bacterium M00.F.Ca.ET.155.01.1.1]MBW0450474.1 NAD-dependent epimerase/dehydratase family protein [Paraburkholderia phenoliruptrix]MBW9098802.1 NAD-dependent